VPELEEDYEKADEFKRLVYRRTGIKANKLVCPRERSEYTPCIARDGRNAVAEDIIGGVCAGCDYTVDSLLKLEQN
jgi:hypothetical protein